VPLRRYVVEAVPAPLPPAGRDLGGARFAITDDGRGIAERLAANLRARNAQARVVNFKAAEASAFGGLDGLIHLWPLHEDSETADLKRFFPLMRELLLNGGRFLLTAGSVIGGRAGDGTLPKG